MEKVRENAHRAAVLVGFSTFGVSPLQRTELADRAHACRCARRADGPRLFGPAGVIHPPPVAAICYEVEPVDGPARITVQSELTANEQLPPAGADPRVAAALEDPLRGEYHDATGTAVVLVHKTRRSGLRVGAAMDHLVDCPAPVRAESRFADGGLVTAATVLAPGQKLRVIKFGG
jgi:hypothetical protein